MALYHYNIKVVKRGKGQSSVAGAAYRAGERLVDERTGEVHDYRRRSGVVAPAEILAPPGAPGWAYDRSTVWNKAELAERQWNAQPARSLDMAIPEELPREAGMDLVRRHVQGQFVRQGMIADVSWHEDENGRGHAHVLLTMRELKGQEFAKRKSKDWSDRGNCQVWRTAWATDVNLALEAAGFDARVHPGTLEEQWFHTLHQIADVLQGKQPPLTRDERMARVQRLANEAAHLDPSPKEQRLPLIEEIADLLQGKQRPLFRDERMARTRALAEHVTRLERPAQMKRGPVLTHRPEAAPDRGAEFAVAEAERLDAVRAAEQTLAVADELARRTLERQATERALDDEIIRLENEHPSADDAYRHAKKPPRALPARPAVQIEALYAEQERRRAEERDRLLREVAYLEHEHPNAAEAYRHAKEWPRALPARPANELEALYAEQNQRDRVRARAQAEEESGRQQPPLDEETRRQHAFGAEAAESDVRDDLDDLEVAPGERPQVIVTHTAAEAAASLSFDGETAGVDQEVASRHAPLHEETRQEQPLEAEPAESDVRDDLDDPEVAPGERPQVIVTHTAAEAAASLSFDGETAGVDQEVASRHAPLHEETRQEQPLEAEPAESDVRDDLDDPEVAPGERPQVIVTHTAAEAAASLSFDGETAGVDQEVASRHAPLHEETRQEQPLEAEPAESDVRDDLDDPEVAPGERPQVIVTHTAAEAAASLSFDGETAGVDQEVEQEGRPTDTHEREVEPLALGDGRGHDAEVSPDVVRGADRQVGGDRRAQRGPDRRPKSRPRS